MKRDAALNVFLCFQDSVVDLTDPCPINCSQPLNGGPTACHSGDRKLPMCLGVIDRLSQEARATQTVSASPLPPPLPSILEVCRARLRAEKPVRHPAGGLTGGTDDLDELPASRAAELLLSAESGLLQRRERRRLANRTQLQELLGCSDELVFIPL